MRVIVSLLLVSAVILAGCGKKSEDLATEKTLEAALGGDVDIQGSGADATLSVMTDDGEMVYGIGDSPPFPSNYPSDVVVLQHSQLDTAVSMGETVAIGYRTKQSTAEAFGRLKSEMSGKGWKETFSEQNRGGQSILMFQKDARTMQYQFDPGEEEGVLMVMQAHSAPEKE